MVDGLVGVGVQDIRLGGRLGGWICQESEKELGWSVGVTKHEYGQTGLASNTVCFR